MKKLMHRVTILNTMEIVMFENRATAEAYVGILESQGIYASLNKWSWETTIED